MRRLRSVQDGGGCSEAVRARTYLSRLRRVREVSTECPIPGSCRASREELRSSDGLTTDLVEALHDLNAPAEALAAQLARELYGRAARPQVERVVFAVYGIPYTAVRHRRPGRDLGPMRDLVRVASGAVLRAELPSP